MISRQTLNPAGPCKVHMYICTYTHVHPSSCLRFWLLTTLPNLEYMLVSLGLLFSNYNVLRDLSISIEVDRERDRYLDASGPMQGAEEVPGRQA